MNKLPAPFPAAQRNHVSYWLPVVLWVGLMMFFSSVPDPYAPVGVEGTTTYDVLGHSVGFAVLAFLVIRWLRSRQEKAGGRVALWTALACLAYALFDELHQIPIPGRSFEWHDMAIDAVGLCLGLAAEAVWRLRTRRRTHIGSIG